MRSVIMTLILLAGCGSDPATYKASNGKTGYSDKMVDPNLKVASFQGNSSTKKEKAQLYAKFHAIEMCKEMNRKLTHILAVQDKTFQKEITQTTSTPTYYYGVAPYYGRYGAYGAGVSMYGAYGPVDTHTSTEVKNIPQFDVYFECVDDAIDARMSYKTLSSADLKNLVKDLKGGVQVDEVLPDSPNKDILQIGDIILKANGTRVATTIELYQAHRNSNAKKFTIEYLHEGKTKTADVKFLNVTDMVANSQAEIIKEACKSDDVKKSSSLCK